MREIPDDRAAASPRSPSRYRSNAASSSSSGELARTGAATVTTPTLTSRSSRHSSAGREHARRRPSGALHIKELLDPLDAQVGRRQAAGLKPATQPRHLPQLVDRRQRRVTALLQLRPVRVRKRSQRPRHHDPADPTRRSGHPPSLFGERPRRIPPDPPARYADLHASNTTANRHFLANVGITSRSAYHP